jgi:hypothetical protein
MKDVDVRRLFVRVTFQRLDVVVFRMPAAGRDLLVLLQMIDVLLLQMPARQIRYPDPRTGWFCRLWKHGPLWVSSVPQMGVALRWSLAVVDRDLGKGVRLPIQRSYNHNYAKVQ